jgi:predicted alpha/beta hydrolase
MPERDVEIPAADGLPLAGTLFTPDQPNGRALIVNPATGVHRRLYRRFAAFMAEAGFTTVIYDYRGMGGSRVSSQTWRRMRVLDWGTKDAAGVMAWTRRSLAPDKLFVCGHSIGGQLLAGLEETWRLDGLLLVAAQSGYYRYWPRRYRWRLWLLWHAAMPLVTRLAGRFPGRLMGGASQDLPPRVGRDWARWCRSRDYLVDDEGRPLRAGARAYRGPILALSFTDDRLFAPRRAVGAMLDWYKKADVDWRQVAPADAGVRAIGHFNFFRDQALRPLWQDTADWLRRAA